MAAAIIPLDRNDSVAVHAIFHKSFIGHVLIAINKSHRPVAAWCDVAGIVPIKSRFIKQNQFVDIISRLKPQKLYLNNGELISSVLQEHELHIYNNESLIEILQRLEIKKSSSVEAIMPSTTANNNTKSSQTSSDLTFADMKILDPTLTRREYKKIINMSSSSVQTKQDRKKR